MGGAAIKIALIVLFFMEVKSSSPLIRLASLAWRFADPDVLADGGDYFTRQ